MCDCDHRRSGIVCDQIHSRAGGERVKEITTYRPCPGIKSPQLEIGIGVPVVGGVTLSQ